MLGKAYTYLRFATKSCKGFSKAHVCFASLWVTKEIKREKKNDRLKFYDSSPLPSHLSRVFHVSLNYEEGLPHTTLYVRSLPRLLLFPHIYSLPLLLFYFTSFSSIKTPHLFTLTLHTQTPLKLQLMEDMKIIFTRGMSKMWCKRETNHKKVWG